MPIQQASLTDRILTKADLPEKPAELLEGFGSGLTPSIPRSQSGASQETAVSVIYA
ncbi:MAG: hypothetical protein IOC39_11345 [Burkholderia sp.]|jgi:hypothetical protein|uniref:hypothetical protein n=1 Tax=Burkholderia TaxID=32008 RepID=UPI00158C6FE2|nr:MULTISPECIES: hypothetical protein [Burkholderia]MCA3644244.1 hypothetical protein [Methylobacterium sp.]MCA3777793.1 hypothetical protein [Burkholderia sp.]MCA3783739.1 hypothetical protein [Burkholderia sp.]MCA3793763.1 hypothetical protein [Burkholderia sp.]MCA3804463.1 hypothetical protein [Burkholderia sp.]